MGTVACDDDDDAQPSDTGEEATVDDGTVEVEMVDFAFEGVPETVPASTTFTVVNSSAEEIHELIALRLPDDETRLLEELVALPEKELQALFVRPPAFVLLAVPVARRSTRWATER